MTDHSVYGMDPSRLQQAFRRGGETPEYQFPLNVRLPLAREWRVSPADVDNYLVTFSEKVERLGRGKFKPESPYTKILLDRFPKVVEALKLSEPEVHELEERIRKVIPEFRRAA